MAGYGDTYFSAGLLLDLRSHFIGYGRERIFFHLFLVIFFGQGSIFLGNRTLSHSDNGKTAALFVPVFDLLDHLIDIIRDLREQDDVRTACHSGIQSQPSHLMPHDFHDEYSAVGSCCGMDAVDGIRSNIYCALETEGHISTPQVIVDGLGQGHDIQSFLAQQVRSLVGAVTTENYKAVQLQLVIVLLHGFHFVQPVGIRILDRLERGPGGSQDRAALGKDAGEILVCQHAEITVNQSSVTVQKTIDFNLFLAVRQGLHHASHGCVQCLTVTTARQHSDSLHRRILRFYISLFSLAFAVTMQNCLRSANTYFYFNTFIFI